MVCCCACVLCMCCKRKRWKVRERNTTAIQIKLGGMYTRVLRPGGGPYDARREAEAITRPDRPNPRAIHGSISTRVSFPLHLSKRRCGGGLLVAMADRSRGGQQRRRKRPLGRPLVIPFVLLVHLVVVLVLPAQAVGAGDRPRKGLPDEASDGQQERRWRGRRPLNRQAAAGPPEPLLKVGVGGISTAAAAAVGTDGTGAFQPSPRLQYLQVGMTSKSREGLGVMGRLVLTVSLPSVRLHAPHGRQGVLRNRGVADPDEALASMLEGDGFKASRAWLSI